MAISASATARPPSLRSWQAQHEPVRGCAWCSAPVAVVSGVGTGAGTGAGPSSRGARVEVAAGELGRGGAHQHEHVAGAASGRG